MSQITLAEPNYAMLGRVLWTRIILALLVLVVACIILSRRRGRPLVATDVRGNLFLDYVHKLKNQ